MAVIPRFLLQHTALIEEYLGESGVGPQYAEPVTVRCFLVDKRTLVRGTNQDTVISSQQIFCRRSVAVPPKSRVTTKGRQATVITYSDADGGRFPTPDHIQVFLT